MGAAGLLLGSVVVAVPPSADESGTSSADVVGTVRLIDSHTAVVQVRYSCISSLEEQNLALRVSVKQSGGVTADPDLAEEGGGYGARATAWSQGRSAVVDPDCDGTTHTGRFTVDRSEYGYRELQKGRAYVQFRLIDATTPIENPEIAPISSMGFVERALTDAPTEAVVPRRVATRRRRAASACPLAALGRPRDRAR